ncbi:DEAD/DEAH box helicase, partial [Listeria monocytogenes]|nr:DEAD/DEAH box helicase [Listeria monocytogenes]
MSLPIEYIRELLAEVSNDKIENIITQTDARRILQEVKEDSENYPNFDVSLTEKATHIAYLLISCGCSLLAQENIKSGEGLLILEKAGKILSDNFKYNSEEMDTKDNNLLISGMALYAAKQFSRSFIVLDNVNLDFSVGQMIILFLKKDFMSLIKMASSIFFIRETEELDIQEFDDWVISHEIARCFLIIIDFMYTGNEDNFRLVNDILEKLEKISFESNLTLNWLIIRLLKIIFLTYQDVTFWSTLPPFLPLSSMTTNYIRLLCSLKSPITELWPSQTESLPLALGNSKGGVVNLRTSGGKTRVAELAILKMLTENPASKVLYLAPFRSLAFEIEQSLSMIFEPLDITVSQLYGGSTANVSDFEIIGFSQVIIATPEKAKALIRSGTELENEVKLIIIDEGHLFGAEKRHIKNEMFFNHLQKISDLKGIRMLLLSAVLPNASELAKWLTNDSSLVAKSDWKPSLERLGLLIWNGNQVNLEWKSEGSPFNPSFIKKAPLGYGRRRNLFPNKKNEAVAATAVRLSKIGTVMIYSARANSIDGLAENVLLALGENPEDFPWDFLQWRIFENICKEELSDDDIVLVAARKGIICHSNRLPAQVRIAIEKLMRSKEALIIIASSTLAQGVNIGISTVIVSTPYYSAEPINNRDFWNICGRAGRAFSDVEGKILYAIDTSDAKDEWQIKKDYQLAQNYFNDQQMKKVESGLLLVLNHFNSLSAQLGIDFSFLIEMVANDFIKYNIADDTVNRINNFFDLIDDELLAMHENLGNNFNLDWVDDTFRNSLAIIQADRGNKELYILLLKSRANALLKRMPDRTIRKKAIASGVPLSVAKALIDDSEYFRNLSFNFIDSIQSGENKSEAINVILQNIELWSRQNAGTVIENIPDQSVLNVIRQPWLSGMPLKEIRKIDRNIDDIAKNYYGFNLPWIVNAIAQIFDKEAEEEINKIYSNLAIFVELGLPDMTAVNIYLAGVRSRNIALELSSKEIFNDRNVSQIKRLLTNFPSEDIKITDAANLWINNFSENIDLKGNQTISFSAFTIESDSYNGRLYIREANQKCFLTSVDGYYNIS